MVLVVVVVVVAVVVVVVLAAVVVRARCEHQDGLIFTRPSWRM